MKANEPSYFLFSKFITRDENGNIDASRLLSRECYEAWLKTRKIPPRLPEESFRKALTSHCKGVAGMKPFAPDAEKAILKLLKKRQIWPCFKGTNVKIGIRGCHLQGYWESKRNGSLVDGEEIPNHSKQIDVDNISPVSSIDQIKRKQSPNIPMFISDGEIKVKIPRLSVEHSKIHELPTTNIESNAVDIPYFFSKVYVHNEEIYGRSKISDYQIPDAAQMPSKKQVIYEKKVPFDVSAIGRNNMTLQDLIKSAGEKHDTIGDFESIDDCLASLEPPADEEQDDMSDSSEKSIAEEKGLQEIIDEVERQRKLYTSLKSPCKRIPSLTVGELSRIIAEFKLAMKKGGFVRDTLQSVFKFLPKKHLIMFIVNLYRHTGFSELFPVHHTVEETTTENMAQFYSRDFVIPNRKDRYFEALKPVGICLGDYATYTIVDQDDASENIYRGSIIGIPSINLRVHKVHAGLYLREMLAELFSSGETWTRSIEYRCDGTVMVLLNRYYMADREANCVLVQHQDITDKYADLL